MTELGQSGADVGPPDEPDGADPTKPRLFLGDPLSTRATEDRPEGWGERAESDADRLAYYKAQRPPHHGG